MIPPRPDRRARVAKRRPSRICLSPGRGQPARFPRRRAQLSRDAARLSPGDRRSLAGAGAGSRSGWNEDPAMDLWPIVGRQAWLVLPQAARAETAIREMGDELAGPG